MTVSDKIVFDNEAAKEYKDFRKNKRILDKICILLKSISEQYDYGIGKPERLKGYEGRFVYSRRIDDKNRIIYEVIKDDNQEISSIIIKAFKGHDN